MLLADVLRLSKFKDYVRRQATFVANYIGTCQAPTIQVSMAAALARSAETIDREFVASLRSLISEDGFTYVLFELAARRDQAAASAFELVLSLPDLRPLDRVLCRHGLDKTLPEAETPLITIGLIEALLTTEGDAEFQLGVSLTQSMSFEGSKGFEILKSAFRRAKDAPTRLKLVAALRRTSSEAAWRGIRMLAASERDERTRSELFKAEEEVRSKHSASSARNGWNTNCGDARLRATLWKALRSRHGP